MCPDFPQTDSRCYINWGGHTEWGVKLLLHSVGTSNSLQPRELPFAGFSSLPFLGRQIFFSSSLTLGCFLFSKLSGYVFVFGSGYVFVTGCSISSLYALCKCLLVCSFSDCAFSSAESVALVFVSIYILSSFTVLGSFVSSVLGSASDGVSRCMV